MDLRNNDEFSHGRWEFRANPQQPAPVLIGSGSQSAHGQPSATIFKGSEILWAVSFWRFPTEVPGCAADGVAPVTPETANFRARAVSILRLACG